MRSTQRLTDRIAEEIKTGKFGASGAFFPTQAVLQKEYGISNSTIVAARKNLEAQGLIESVGRSTFVTYGRARSDSPYMKCRMASGCIGVIVPYFDSLFFGAFCDELSECLRKKGYRTFCVACPEGREKEVLQEVKRVGVDGVVAAVTDRRHVISLYEQMPLPCVLVGARGENIGLSSVDEDPFDAAKRIAKQLVAEECKSFFILRTTKYAISNDRRTNGFMEGLAETGAFFSEENIIEIGSSVKAAVSVLVNRIRSVRKKTGVLFYNLIGLNYFLEQCQAAQLLLHRDMEVATFLDVHRSSREEFPVIVAKTSIKNLAVCAGEEIIRQVTDDTALPEAFKIPYSIHWNGVEPK